MILESYARGLGRGHCESSSRNWKSQLTFRLLLGRPWTGILVQLETGTMPSSQVSEHVSEALLAVYPAIRQYHIALSMFYLGMTYFPPEPPLNGSNEVLSTS